MKKEVFRTVITAWIIISILYIANDLWRDYAIKGIEKAYQDGVSQCVVGIMNEIEKNKCSTVNIKNEEKEISLVSTECIQQDNNNNINTNEQ